MTAKKPNGALWRRSGNWGDYFSGQIEIEGKKYNFNVYENSYKKEEKQPDYKIFLKEDKNPQSIKTKTAPNPKAIRGEMTEEDIPF